MYLKWCLSIFVIIAICAATVNSYTCPGEGIWPHETSINHFYSCLSSGEQGVEVKCLGDTGFLRNDKHTGCIPFSEWECTHKGGENPPDCRNNHGILNPHLNPNNYWVCPEPDLPPIKMTCDDGYLFADTDDFHGCVPFGEWKCSDTDRY